MRLTLGALAAVACLVLPPEPAQASPATLRRAVSAILGGPLDALLSPATAGMSVERSWQAIGETNVERGFYATPGWLGLLVLHAGSGALRTLMGVVQLLPGLVLIPFEADLPVEMDVFSEGDALVDWRNPVVDVKFGIISPLGLMAEPPVRDQGE